MGICWARYCSTAILTCFCTVFLISCAVTEVRAWATDIVRAHEQPDYPGIIKHFINRKAKNGGMITMYYPETGNTAVDRKILSIITKQVKDFEKIGREPYYSPDGFAISNNYIIYKSTELTIGMKFTFCEGTNKAYCGEYIYNFSTIDGRQLSIEDMFEKPQTALNLMSQWARQEIPKQQEALFLIEGTEPQKNNFKDLLITPNGIRIYFGCGQIAPRSHGDPELDMPLKELAAAGPKPGIWGKQQGPREAALSTPLQTPLPDKMQVSHEHATFLVPAGNGLTFPCIDGGSEVENCIRIAPDFMAHFEDAASDFAFVQGQVAHAGAAEATYIWGLYRTADGFRSTPPTLVCQGCKTGKIFIKKDVIMFSQIRQMPSDAQAVDLKFRIADGKLKKAN